MKKAMTGNEAMAEAMRQVSPDVVAAYPITPATEVVQIFAGFVADGIVDTEFIPVESEHSAMSACIGASAAGARAMTSTSSQGLALMWEMLYIASGLRLPIVLAEVNRALSSPINIHCDHSDTMGARDSGWLQIYSENAQEAYDNMIQAIRIAEACRLPVMVTADGFIISHGMEVVEILEDAEVACFVGEHKPAYSVLDIDHPKTVGAIDFTDYYFEHKMQTIQAMREAGKYIAEVAEDFEKRFQRSYSFFEEYKLDDAEIAIVALGSVCGTTKVVVDELRKEGIKAGLLKLRVFRPFPSHLLARALAGCKAIAVLDRADGLSGAGGPLFAEVKSALYDILHRETFAPITPGVFDEDKMIASPPIVKNYVYGLGGRDMRKEHLREIFAELAKAPEGDRGELVRYIGVRG